MLDIVCIDIHRPELIEYERFPPHSQPNLFVKHWARATNLYSQHD